MKKCVTQLLIIAALIIVGCSDPCKDVVCGPGTCDDGTCICPDGYEGNSCETLENAKYFGHYSVTESDCGDLSLSIISAKFEAQSLGGPTEVTILYTVDAGWWGVMYGTLKDGKVEATDERPLPSSPFTINGDFTDTNTFSGVFAREGDFECNITLVK